MTPHKRRVEGYRDSIPHGAFPLIGMALAGLPLSAVLLACGPAGASDVIVDGLDSNIVMANPLTDPELDRLRGGWRIGGFDLSFGLEIRSTIQNVMEIVSLLTVNDVVGNHAIGTLTHKVWKFDVSTGENLVNDVVNSTVNAAVNEPVVDIAASGAIETTAEPTVTVQAAAEPPVTETPAAVPVAVVTTDLEAAGAVSAAVEVVEDTVTETPTGAGVEVVHSFDNGISSLISNTINGVSVSQKLVLNVEIQNYSQSIAAARGPMMAAGIANTIATFRPSR